MNGPEDLTQSPHVGVRWQAQMEQHLRDMRTLTHEAMLQGIDPSQALIRAHLAQAHATAALALATANNDIADEVRAGLDSVTEAIQDSTDYKPTREGE